MDASLQSPSLSSSEDPPGSGSSRRQHLLVVVGGALAVFLLGAAAGTFLGLPGNTMTTPPADSVDVGFSQDMSVHHEQAVEMAAWVRERSTDPVIRALAYDIETTQTAEIGRMQGWLTVWEASPFPPGAHMAWMVNRSVGHSTHAGIGSSVPAGGVAAMPGMASPEDLQALRAASGRELDVLFLQLMLRHHEGATAMLAYAAEYAQLPAVRSLAASMASAQANESGYIRTLLAERQAAPTPPE